MITPAWALGGSRVAALVPWTSRVWRRPACELRTHQLTMFFSTDELVNRSHVTSRAGIARACRACHGRPGCTRVVPTRSPPGTRSGRDRFRCRYETARRRAGGSEPLPADKLVPHQPALSEHSQVTAHGRPADLKVPGDLSCREPAAAQHDHNLPAHRVSDRPRHFIHTESVTCWLHVRRQRERRSGIRRAGRIDGQMRIQSAFHAE